MLFRFASSIALFLIGNVAAEHPHFQCAARAPFHENDWFEWANCEWTMEHPQKCKRGEQQRMMTCQVVCHEAVPEIVPASKICEKAKIDLTLLVDGSGSVGTTNFGLTRDFLENIASHLDVGNDATVVNMIQFSDHHNVEIMNSMDKDELLEAIENMDYHDGSDTLTGAALTFSRDEIFMSSMVRPDATQVLLVVTDGKAKDDILLPMAEIHAMGIETVSVGVGSGVDMDQLEQLASKKANMHAEADFASLAALQENLTKELCRIVQHGGHMKTTVAPSTMPTMNSSTVSTAASASANPV